MLSGIREGNADAIHNARVATRRLRAALPIAWANRPRAELEAAERDVRRVGRALGRARDVDITLDLLAGAELRIRGAARAICQLRADLGSRQWREQRRLVKRVEKIPLFEVSSAPVRRLLPHVEWKTDARWRLLETALLQHADLLNQTADAAGGIYFPNRSHSVRIQTKKLRYLLELVPGAHDRLAPTLKALAKAQKVLGAVQDRQVAAAVVAEAAADAVSGGPPPDEYRALQEWLMADARELHAKYAGQRDGLHRAIREVRGAVEDGACRPLTVARTLAAVGVVAAPSVAMLLRERLEAGRRPPAVQPSTRDRDPEPRGVAGDRRQLRVDAVGEDAVPRV
jgi:CHAD domain-containing protein